MTIDEISKKLAEIRVRKGISQYAISKQGMNIGTIRAIEEGKSVTLSNWLRYCEIVGVDIEVTPR